MHTIFWNVGKRVKRFWCYGPMLYSYKDPHLLSVLSPYYVFFGLAELVGLLDGLMWLRAVRFWVIRGSFGQTTPFQAQESLMPRSLSYCFQRWQVGLNFYCPKVIKLSLTSARILLQLSSMYKWEDNFRFNTVNSVLIEGFLQLPCILYYLQQGIKWSRLISHVGNDTGAKW